MVMLYPFILLLLVSASGLAMGGTQETKWNLQGSEVQQKCYAMPEKGMPYYTNDKHMDGFGWFQAMWTVMDLMLGQFILTPVSGASVSWVRTISKGHLPKTSSICTSFDAFGESLEGLETTSIVVHAGSTSIECQDATIAGWMTDHFSSLCSASSTKSQWFWCNGYFWEIGHCGGPAISISAQAKTAHCTCAVRDAAVIIRPCVDGVSWGGTKANVCDSPTTTLSVTVFHTTDEPTNLPTETTTETPSETPTVQPTNSSMLQTRDDVNMINDFDTVNRDGDATLNYHEIAFAIADANKDSKLSLAEYQAARAERIFVDTSYMHTNSSIADDVDLIADFDIIDRNADGVLNYDEVAYAVADTTKDGKLSYDEYEAARADGIFVDTSYAFK